MKNKGGKVRDYKVRGNFAARCEKQSENEMKRKKMGKAREIKFPKYNH